MCTHSNCKFWNTATLPHLATFTTFSVISYASFNYQLPSIFRCTFVAPIYFKLKVIYCVFPAEIEVNQIGTRLVILSSTKLKEDVMKRVMRAATTTLAAILIFAFTATSQTNEREGKTYNHQRNFKELEYSLQSEIPGIVESTIYTVVLYKNRFPDLDYSRLQSGLDEVARDNGDVAISYKARLASTYLTYSTNIQITPVSPALDHEYLFRQIAEQLEQKLLAAHID